MEGLICFFIVGPRYFWGGEADLDQRICLLRIHDHSVVRLHIARACI